MISSNINLVIAFAAGVISFVSPCVLPLIPSYLSFIGGISYNELKTGDTRKTGVFVKTIFFVSGFSIVFIVLGIIFSSMGVLLGRISGIINITAGILVILLGLNFIFDFWKILEVEKKFHIRKSPGGYAGAVILGMAFAWGWTPCVGPILAGILLLAGTTGRLASGILLLTSYSLGLGLPFILAGLFFNGFTRQIQKIRPYLKAIKTGSGIFLIFIGILILLGRLQKLNIALFNLAGLVEQAKTQNPVYITNLFATIFLIPGLLLLVFYIRNVFKNRRTEKTRLHLLWLFFTIFFLVTAALTFLKIIDISRIFTFWITFQGI